MRLRSWDRRFHSDNKYCTEAGCGSLARIMLEQPVTLQPNTDCWRFERDVLMRASQEVTPGAERRCWHASTPNADDQKYKPSHPQAAGGLA